MHANTSTAQVKRQIGFKGTGNTTLPTDHQAPIFSANGKEPWDLDDAAWFKKNSARFYRLRAAFPGETTDDLHVVVRYWAANAFKRFTGNFAVADRETAAKGLYVLLESGGTAADIGIFASAAWRGHRTHSARPGAMPARKLALLASRFTTCVERR
jgi:hypothetical protein